jgi:hypothetical protein
MYDIQHCFICRPSDSTVSEDAGIEPRTVAFPALAVTVKTFFTKRFNVNPEKHFEGGFLRNRFSTLTLWKSIHPMKKKTRKRWGGGGPITSQLITKEYFGIHIDFDFGLLSMLYIFFPYNQSSVGAYGEPSSLCQQLQECRQSNNR